jgi:hypothetical protein
VHYSFVHLLADRIAGAGDAFQAAGREIDVADAFLLRIEKVTERGRPRKSV